VDEKGTEAAAATAISEDTGGPGDQSPPLLIRVNRPFLFVITDTKTGAVIFIGHVIDPTIH